VRPTVLPGTGFLRDPAGDAVEPAGQRRGRADVGRPAGQDQEGGLEGVFSVMHVGQQPSAYPEDHWTVPADHRGKGILIALGDELLEQAGIALLVGVVPVRESSKLAEQARGGGHRGFPAG
jgi:hypothetical protein